AQPCQATCGSIFVLPCSKSVPLSISWRTETMTWHRVTTNDTYSIWMASLMWNGILNVGRKGVDALYFQHRRVKISHLVCLHDCTETPERKIQVPPQSFCSLSSLLQVSICLECNSSKLRDLKRKWIRCSAQATVLHLKKFIAKKLNLTSFNELDILCNEEILGKDHTLKFVVVTRWRFKKSPLLLHYRPKMDLL
ncbi:unnamed protein product, partial [Oncorhynchus mykiss]